MAPSTLPVEPQHADDDSTGHLPSSTTITTDGDTAAAVATATTTTAPDGGMAGPPAAQCRRIQVSREKRPLNFFVTLSKKFLQTDEVIELSGLGLAVTTVVTIAEILKTAGLVVLDHIETSLVEPHPDGHSSAPKAKIQIWLRKTPQFDALVAAAPTTAPGANHHHHHHHNRSRNNNNNNNNNNSNNNNSNNSSNNNSNSNSGAGADATAASNGDTTTAAATDAVVTKGTTKSEPKKATGSAKDESDATAGDTGSTKSPAPDELPLPLRGDRAVTADAA